MKINISTNNNDTTIVVYAKNNETLRFGDHVTLTFVVDQPDGPDTLTDAEKERALAAYIEDPARRKQVISHLSRINSAYAFAYEVVAELLDIKYLTEDRIVKENFIQTLLAFAPNIKKGRSTNNFRDQIKKMLAEKKFEADREAARRRKSMLP